MKIRGSLATIGIITCGVILGLGRVAIASWANAGDDVKDDVGHPTTAPSPQAGLPSATVTPSYDQNENGDTIGVWKIGAVPPDLVEGYSDDGKPGFIYVSDLSGGPTAKSPGGGAVTMTQDGRVLVPVYERDGKTQIGVFTAAEMTAQGPDSQGPAKQ